MLSRFFHCRHWRRSRRHRRRLQQRRQQFGRLHPADRRDVGDRDTAGSLGWGDRQGILDREAEGGRASTRSSTPSSSPAATPSPRCSPAPSTLPPSATTRHCAPAAATRMWFSWHFDSVEQRHAADRRERRPHRHPRSLVGKSITAPQGTIRDRTARQLIEAAGLTGKIEVKDVPTPESIAGLSSGQIDATILSGAQLGRAAGEGLPRHRQPVAARHGQHREPTSR